MFIHKKAAYSDAVALGHRIIFFLISIYHPSERVKKPIQRMPFIGADFIDKTAQELDRPVIFILIGDGKKMTDRSLALPDSFRWDLHFFFILLCHIPNGRGHGGHTPCAC